MKVRCPNCTRICFETTDQFNPDLPPHGGMVKSLLQYHIDWLCAPTTKAAEMCCPECLAPLVVGGVLNVMMPARDAGEFLGMKIVESNHIPDNIIAMVSGDSVETIKIAVNDLQVPIRDNAPQAHMDGDKLNIVDPKNFKFFCDVCGKECKNQLGLNSHKKSHKGGK